MIEGGYRWRAKRHLLGDHWDQSVDLRDLRAALYSHQQSLRQFSQSRIQTATRERIRDLHLHVPIWVPYEIVGCQVGILKDLYMQVYFTRAFFISVSLFNPSGRRLSLLIFKGVQTIYNKCYYIIEMFLFCLHII